MVTFYTKKSTLRDVKSLENMPTSQNPFQKVRSLPGSLIPDAASNMLYQVKTESFGIKEIKDSNKVVKNVKKTVKQGIWIQKLDREPLHLLVYSYALLANNQCFTTSQLGYSFLLSENFHRCNLLHYASYKSRRVCRSVLGAEVYAFTDSFEYAYVMRHGLKEVLEQRVALQMFTNAHSLFDVIVKNSTTGERHLLINIKDFGDSYNSQKISIVGFLRSENNPADAFTKAKLCKALDFILATYRNKSFAKTIRGFTKVCRRGNVSPWIRFRNGLSNGCKWIQMELAGKMRWGISVLSILYPLCRKPFICFHILTVV